MKTKLFVFLAAVVCLSLVAQTAPAAKKLKVIASIPCLASITQSIGGDRIDVKTIARGSQDAHYIEAKPSYMVELSKADLLICSGLELEIGWLPLLIQGARNSKVAVGTRGNLNASTAIPDKYLLEKPRGELDRSMGDVHPTGNPHYLLNPHNGIKVAALIESRLAELDPANKDFFQANLKRFNQEMELKIAQWESKASILRGMEVVTYHPHWSYLINWLGMKSMGYVELKPGIPPTPKHKQAIIQTVKERNIKLILVSSWKDPTAARDVAQTGGATLVILPGEVGAMPGTDNYTVWFDFIINELVRAVSGTGSTPASVPGTGQGQGYQRQHRGGRNTP